MTQNRSKTKMILLLTLSMPGCTSDDLPAETTTGASTAGSDSLTEPTTTTPTEAYYPDQFPCHDPVIGCSNDADCCATPEIGCEAYPNKWTCESGLCLQHGCESDVDCKNLLDSFSCLELSAQEFRCVAACTLDSDCVGNHSMANTVCAGTSLTQKFCTEDI